MKVKFIIGNISLSILLSMFQVVNAQISTEKVESISIEVDKINNTLHHRLDIIEKRIDDLLWYERVGDIAHIDKLYMTGPPLWKEKNPNAQGAGNPTKFWSYVFIPKNIDAAKKYPLIVFPHGGVHADFTTYYTHIVRELIAQGYIIVAAEYRGSTGYGESHYKKIDYGGLETEAVMTIIAVYYFKLGKWKLKKV